MVSLGLMVHCNTRFVLHSHKSKMQSLRASSVGVDYQAESHNSRVVVFSILGFIFCIYYRIFNLIYQYQYLTYYQRQTLFLAFSKISVSSLLPLPSTHKFATASLAPCLTTAQSPLLSTSPYNCYGLKILRQAMSILLKSMPFKPLFVETSFTGLILKIL